MIRGAIPPLKIQPSRDLRRVLEAYATLHQRALDAYVLDLILDGIEAEGTAKLDLTQIPEIMYRGGPKLTGRVIATREPDGVHKRYNARGLAGRLGLSTHRIGEIKRANAFLAAQGKESLIFNGRLSTVARISEWLDQHPDWRAAETRNPEPHPDSKAALEVAKVKAPFLPGRIPSAVGGMFSKTPAEIREHGKMLRRFLSGPERYTDNKAVHGASKVAEKCGFTWHLLQEVEDAANQHGDRLKDRGAWTRPSRIREWLTRHAEFLERYPVAP